MFLRWFWSHFYVLAKKQKQMLSHKKHKLEMCWELNREQLEVTSYLSTFKELEGRADVRDPVDSF